MNGRRKSLPSKGRPRKRLSQEQLEMAARILNLDVARRGEINRSRCPVHGKQALSYLFSGGLLYVFCEKCMWRTSFSDQEWQS